MSEYYAIQSNPGDFLQHYGVRGMKWGVRKAIQSGNGRALGRQYAKAAKKLAKLEKRANSGKKYAKRAAALGLGAAAAGGVAATGTRGIAAVTKGAGKGAAVAMRGLGAGALGAANVAQRLGIRGAGRLRSASKALYTAGNRTQLATGTAGNAIETWGKGTSVGSRVSTAGNNAIDNSLKALRGSTQGGKVATQLVTSGTVKNARGLANRVGNISNSGYTRLAGAAVGAGLGAAAGYNAYRAATTKRAAKKAAQFRSEMNKAFAGTQYANGRPRQGKKNRSKK